MAVHDPFRRSLLAALLTAAPFGVSAQTLLDRGLEILKEQSGGSAPGSGARRPSSTGAGLNLSPGEIGAGLKDALKVAAKRVVSRLGRTDGYNGDSAIRIPLPDPLQRIASPLRSIGASFMLDDLQLKMNRAAEQAAPRALNIFADAASKMTINDARGILSGPQDAATQYFHRTTSGSLGTAFRPIVDKTLSGVGAVSTFKSVQGQAAAIPVLGQDVQNFNLTDFTVGKALDGLFHYLGTEEAAIRTNPAARTTDLLKRVFS